MRHKIKVLHLIESLKSGGAEKRLVSDIKNLGSDNFVHFLCYMYRGYELVSEVPSYANVRCLNMRNIYDIIAGFMGMKAVIKEFVPDIIHTHVFGANIYGRVLGRIFSKAKIVSTLHSIDYMKYISETRSSFSYKVRMADFLTSFCVDAFVAVSSYINDLALKTLKVKRIEVIYNYPEIAYSTLELNGIDKSCVKRQLGADGAFIVFNCGNLRPQKGHRYLISAMAEVVKNVPNAKLLIAGSGPLLSELKEQIGKLNLEGSVSLLGRRDDIMNILCVSDLFVFPSLEEGQGLALIEAMAAGLPCVASNIGPIPEIIPNAEAGILVKPGDPDGLAGAIFELYSDRNKAKAMAAAGKRYAMGKFNARSSVDRLSRLYEELYEKNTAHSRS